MARCRLSDKKIKHYNKIHNWNFSVLLYRGGYGDYLIGFDHANKDDQISRWGDTITVSVPTYWVNRKTGETELQDIKGSLSKCWCGCTERVING